MKSMNTTKYYIQKCCVCIGFSLQLFYILVSLYLNICPGEFIYIKVVMYIIVGTFFIVIYILHTNDIQFIQ